MSNYSSGSTSLRRAACGVRVTRSRSRASAGDEHISLSTAGELNRAPSGIVIDG